ncbi:tRNA epoxyqueuosine(34) reductase QueG [Porphyromonas sp.]|uniref:tRNA epoxyqueuosine(34) reductase QueG n=1 Tax=Porphyromonas sp. TaxID=1924944 RepID=UPI0026DD2ACF|nr:tRNA epoxyqueuosine(34) reductase QueG [Porphyromonas sp.]MDO4695874.1 tRNA epoxyqueuosine(34) reductase QueG [Porphyromonas sp.]MDO4771398.1 tRNA epoxyqueuosine(34) reductase QueG [Porphyromonas sp.]
MNDVTLTLQKIAEELNIDRIGIASLDEPVDARCMEHYDEWISSGLHADMAYLADHRTLRNDPRTLLPEANSMIVCAVSYYPATLQSETAPQVSKYAYGRDYHKVLKKVLTAFAERIISEVGEHTYRVCIDTAPISERYWAQRTGIGHIGKNKNIIIPKVGSYVFLGEILTSHVFSRSEPINKSCGSCTRCVDACPTGALSLTELDARRCLSYLTIEHRGDIPEDMHKALGTRIYGCDTCQDVCPYNHNPAKTRLFPSSQKILTLSDSDLYPFTEERYAELFFGSAITRAKYQGMKRNIDIYFDNKRFRSIVS